MGICVVICLCAVLTPLYNSMEPNVIGFGLGHCQCKYTIIQLTNTVTTVFRVLI